MIEDRHDTGESLQLKFLTTQYPETLRCSLNKMQWLENHLNSS